MRRILPRLSALTLLMAGLPLCEATGQERSTGHPLALAVLEVVKGRLGPERTAALVIEVGHSCTSALRGPVVCGSDPSDRTLSLVGDIEVALLRRSAQAAREAMARGAFVAELPVSCKSPTSRTDLLLIEDVSGTEDEPVVVYMAVTMDPGTSCRVGGGAKLRLELKRDGNAYRTVKETVIAYY